MRWSSLKYLLVLAAFATAANCAPAQPQVSTAPAVTVPASQPAALYDFRQATLPNGLHVITVEDFANPTVAVQVWYHVGSKNEQPNRSGFAHMFEHMMFRGTERVKDIDKLVNSIGGECNAYTTYDTTSFVDLAPANQLEAMLWMEAERMGFLKVNQENFSTERKVVEEELLMYCHEPYGRLEDRIVEHLFSVHPYRSPVVGRVSHLRAASVEELRRFWETYYVPNNATLVICGAVSHDDALRLARKHMGWLPQGKDVPQIAVREPMPKGPRTITVRNIMAPSPLVGVVYRTVPEGGEDHLALDMLGVVLGLGDSGRLQAELVRDKCLARQAKAFQESVEQDGAFVAGVMIPGPDKDGAWPEGGDPNTMLAAVEEQVERLRTQEITEAELVKARNQMLRSMYEDAQTLAGKATAIAEAAILAGDANRVNAAAAQIEAMTAQKLQQVAKKYFDPQAVLRVIVQQDESCDFLKADAEATAPHTGDSNASPVPRAEIDRPKDLGDQPPLAAPMEIKPQPPCLREAMDNGLKIVVSPNHRTPLVTVYLGITAGSCTDTKPGVADFAVQMLARGTQRGCDDKAIGEQEKRAITITSGADLDDSYVMGACLAEHLDKTVEMMAQVVQDTEFTEAEMNSFRDVYLSEMALGDATPDYAAKMEFRSRLYGEHPYGRDSVGLTDEVDALAKGDVQQWCRKFLRPDQAVIIIAGDVDEKSAAELVKKHFAAWQGQGKRPEPQLPSLPKIDKTRIYLIDRPECAQSQIFVGCGGIARSDEARYASMVVNDYFGSNTCSRLFSRILNDKGLTYNIYGAYEPRRHAGEFCINTFSRTESTAEVLKAVLKEVQALRDEPPSDEELARSKRYLKGSVAAKRETNSAIATDLWLAASQGLDGDYVAKMLQGIAATDAKQCQELIERTIDPGKLVIVVVGNAAAIRKDLKKIAPVRVVETDDEGD